MLRSLFRGLSTRPDDRTADDPKPVHRIEREVRAGAGPNPQPLIRAHARSASGRRWRPSTSRWSNVTKACTHPPVPGEGHRRSPFRLPCDPAPRPRGRILRRNAWQPGHGPQRLADLRRREFVRAAQHPFGLEQYRRADEDVLAVDQCARPGGLSSMIAGQEANDHAGINGEHVVVAPRLRCPPPCRRGLGAPLYGNDANTSSVVVSANSGAGLRSTPSGVSSTTRRVPASHRRRRRIALGRITCPFMETVVVNLSAAVTVHSLVRRR